MSTVQDVSTTIPFFSIKTKSTLVRIRHSLLPHGQTQNGKSQCAKGIIKEISTIHPTMCYVPNPRRPISIQRGGWRRAGR
jgi:hypothetical protein